MASLTARTLQCPESDSSPPPRAPRPATGAVWVGVYDTAGTQLAARRTSTSGLGGEPFVGELYATVEALGHTVTSDIRTAGDEVEFDVEPAN